MLLFFWHGGAVAQLVSNLRRSLALPWRCARSLAAPAVRSLAIPAAPARSLPIAARRSLAAPPLGRNEDG